MFLRLHIVSMKRAQNLITKIQLLDTQSANYGRKPYKKDRAYSHDSTNYLYARKGTQFAIGGVHTRRLANVVCCRCCVGE